LIAIGYKYDSSKVFCIIATKNAGSKLPGESYQVQFVDEFKNKVSQPFDHPEKMYVGTVKCD